MSEPVIVLIDGPVAVVTVTNPPVNAIDDAVLEGLGAAAAELAANRSVRAVVLTGAGDKAFMAGADLNAFKEMLAGASSIEHHTALTRRVFGAWESLPQPTVAAIQASAVGGGLEAALVCDLLVADARARFGFPEVRLGLIPGAGGTQRLLRRAGVGAAKELLYLGTTVGAAEAKQLGIVNVVAEDGTALERAVALAERLASLPALAVQAAKQAVASNIDAGLDREHELFVTLFNSADVREGVDAFLGKREPHWSHE